MCPCFLGDTQRWSGFCCFCPGALIEQLKSGGKFKISFLILGIVTEPPLWRVCVSGIQVSQVSGKSTDLSFWSVADSDFFFHFMWCLRVCGIKEQCRHCSCLILEHAFCHWDLSKCQSVCRCLQLCSVDGDIRSQLVNVYLNQIISGHCISSKKSCFRSDFLHKQHTNYYSR